MHEFWLYRCAELTVENGFDLMALRPGQTSSSTEASREDPKKLLALLKPYVDSNGSKPALSDGELTLNSMVAHETITLPERDVPVSPAPNAAELPLRSSGDVAQQLRLLQIQLHTLFHARKQLEGASNGGPSCCRSPLRLMARFPRPEWCQRPLRIEPSSRRFGKPWEDFRSPRSTLPQQRLRPFRFRSSHKHEQT